MINYFFYLKKISYIIILLYCADDTERALFVAAHVAELRRVALFSTATILVATENNLGLSASSIERDLRLANVPNIEFIRESKNPDRVGVVTTEERKLQYESVTRTVLLNDQLVFSTNCISGNPFIALKDERLPLAKNKLRTQMRQMKHIDILPKHPGARARTVVSGKFDHNGSYIGNKDDLALTLMMGIYWYELWERFSTTDGAVISTQPVAMSSNRLSSARSSKRKII